MHSDLDLNPDQYEAEYGVTVLPTLKTSVTAAHRKFLHDHAGRYIAYRAVRDRTGSKFPIDHVVVFAILNDESEEEQAFLVHGNRYALGLTPFGYVVNEQLDQPVAVGTRPNGK